MSQWFYFPPSISYENLYIHSILMTLLCKYTFASEHVTFTHIYIYMLVGELRVSGGTCCVRLCAFGWRDPQGEISNQILDPQCFSCEIPQTPSGATPIGSPIISILLCWYDSKRLRFSSLVFFYLVWLT